MARQIFVYIIHKEGNADDMAYEMVTAAQKIDPDALIIAVVAGAGADLDSVCNEVASSFQEVWKIEDEALLHANAEVLRGLLARTLPKKSIVLVPHEHFGMDLSPGLSVVLDAAYLPDTIDFEEIEGETLKAIRQEHSGQVSTHVLCDVSDGAVITVRPGSFKASESRDANGRLIDKTAEALEGGLPGSNRRFLEVVEAEVGDVDITKSDILISVGRGIEDEDNLEIILDLAEAMGGDVSCSRPIVDAKWLEKSRQVGTSGKTVQPKVYMALGISGAFQHLGGIKGSSYIVAINKNPRAPIFQAADIGVVADILDFVPELTEKINDIKG